MEYGRKIIKTVVLMSQGKVDSLHKLYVSKI